MITWTDEEVAKIAKEFVTLRISDPIESGFALMLKAMHKTIPEDRWRNIPGWKMVPKVARKIKAAWEAKITEPTGAAPSLEEGPMVIQIEVEKPIDYRELLAKLDGPTIAALAFAKLDGVMGGLNLARVEAPKLPTDPKPAISILEAASPKRARPRVAIVTHSSQFGDILTRLRRSKTV